MEEISTLMGEAPAINLTSNQKWISVKEGIPDRENLTGSFCGNYLCIVERPCNKNSLSYVPGGISKTVELCYYNNLAKLWQDKDSEWVKVTHWTQIPKLPFHNTALISREEMLIRIGCGELKMIYHKKETDAHYQENRAIALSTVSYDEPVFYSSTRSNHIEDYMYAIKINE